MKSDPGIALRGDDARPVVAHGAIRRALANKASSLTIIDAIQVAATSRQLASLDKRIADQRQARLAGLDCRIDPARQLLLKVMNRIRYRANG